MLEYKFLLNGQPIEKITEFNLDCVRGKNQRRKDRKEYFKIKRKMRGSISFEIPKEKPWHEKIIIKT